MKKIGLILCALSLSACGAGTLDTVASIPTAPVEVADKTQLDETAGVLAETLYTAAVKLGTLAFRTGLVKPSTNPAVQQDNFCQLVAAGQFTPTVHGSRLSAVECKLRAARDKTRAAYKGLNAASYKQASDEVAALGKELLAIIGGN
jgi:hypothetical protein